MQPPPPLLAQPHIQKTLPDLGGNNERSTGYRARDLNHRFERMDGAYLGGVLIAQHKAMTSAKFPFSTRQFSEFAFGKEGKPGMVPGIANFPGIVTFAGGLPIITANKVQIGGIGVSGGTSDQDEQCAQAGIDAVKSELT